MFDILFYHATSNYTNLPALYLFCTIKLTHVSMCSLQSMHVGTFQSISGAS